jgi:peptidoglycan/LPS O-acetylase OafA/YrhL
MQYRREVDGLRAIAVLPVMFFHAGFQWFRGGFVGVDVFFVISGYLITGILLADLRSGSFTLAKFYERRIRRILPALFLVMLACLPFAWFLMLPDDLENFGQSLFATTLFSNNVLLWMTSGYFSLASEFKPLVHTWSLGVEEQYYLLFPLLLALLWRLPKAGLVSVLVIGAAVSLAVAQWGCVNAPQATFFLLGARLWELLVGALIAVFFFYREPAKGPIVANPTVRSLLGVAGFLMIGASVMLFDRATPFPSVYALLPTVGTALIILFGTPDTPMGRLLGSSLLVGIGLVSYSAYLWHQPLLAFARLTSLSEPPAALFASLLVVAFGLAWISWRYVERPFRDRGLISARSMLAVLLVVGASLAWVGLLIDRKSGFVRDWSELETQVKDAGRSLNAVYNDGPFRYLYAPFDGSKPLKLLVVGTSFARDFINAGDENQYFHGVSLSYVDDVPACLQSEAEVNERLKLLLRAADYVVLGSPPDTLACFQRYAEVFENLGARKIIVIGIKNFGWNMNGVMRLDEAERYAYRAEVLEEVRVKNAEAVRTLPADRFVNLLEILDDETGRIPVFTPDRKVISQDREHLTQAGAGYVGRLMFEHPLLRPIKQAGRRAAS